MICENCGKEHDGSYGSGRFCSSACRSNYQLELIKGKGAQATKEKYRKIRKQKLDSILLNENPPSILKGNLKDHLFEFGIKARICECCGLDTWMGQPIPLQLHHKDGNHENNLLENLQVLCPNCHSQTDTYGFRNMNKKLGRT